MKLAIAGDSAGEGLAKVLADHLKERFEVSEVSRTDEGPDAFYANLADREGVTPTRHARERGYKTMVRMLMRARGH